MYRVSRHTGLQSNDASEDTRGMLDVNGKERARTQDQPFDHISAPPNVVGHRIHKKCIAKVSARVVKVGSSGFEVCLVCCVVRCCVAVRSFVFLRSFPRHRAFASAPSLLFWCCCSFRRSEDSFDSEGLCETCRCLFFSLIYTIPSALLLHPDGRRRDQ